MSVLFTEESVIIIIAHNKHLLNIYYMPDPVLRDLDELTCFVLKIPCMEDTTLISILWMRNLGVEGLSILHRVPQLVSGRMS